MWPSLYTNGYLCTQKSRHTSKFSHFYIPKPPLHPPPLLKPFSPQHHAGKGLFFLEASIRAAAFWGTAPQLCKHGPSSILLAKDHSRLYPTLLSTISESPILAIPPSAQSSYTQCHTAPRPTPCRVYFIYIYQPKLSCGRMKSGLFDKIYIP